MRRTVLWVLTTASATVLLAGCGGSDGPETVNGCVIEPSTSCASVGPVRRRPVRRRPLAGDALGHQPRGNQPQRCEPHRGEPRRGADRRYRPLRRRPHEREPHWTQRSRARTSRARPSAGRHAPTERSTTRAARPPPTPPRRPTRATRPTTVTSPAEVTSFDVGDLQCGAATTAPVTVTWATENATAVEIAVDSFTPAGFGPSGSTNVVVPCDDASHTITITPRNDSGPGEPESKDVSAS